MVHNAGSPDRYVHDDAGGGGGGGAVTQGTVPWVVDDPDTQAALASILALLTGGIPITGEVEVKNDAGSPIPISAASLPLPAGAATEATLAAIRTAVELLDNIVSGSEAQVDVVTSVLPTGAATEATLSDIRTAVQLLDNIVSGNEAQVDVITLPALPAGSNNIGDVDIASFPTGTLANGAETAVSSSAVSVLASNANRKAAIIQNVGANNVRVGITGVTATTGVQLKPGGSLTLSMPYVHTGAVFAIRESADSTVLAQEVA